MLLAVVYADEDVCWLPAGWGSTAPLYKQDDERRLAERRRCSNKDNHPNTRSGLKTSLPRLD